MESSASQTSHFPGPRTRPPHLLNGVVLSNVVQVDLRSIRAWRCLRVRWTDLGAVVVAHCRERSILLGVGFVDILCELPHSTSVAALVNGQVFLKVDAEVENGAVNCGDWPEGRSASWNELWRGRMLWRCQFTSRRQWVSPESRCTLSTSADAVHSCVSSI